MSEAVDHLAVRADELLAAVKKGLAGELDLQSRLQLVADAAAFNVLAANLGLLALAVGKEEKT